MADDHILLKHSWRIVGSVAIDEHGSRWADLAIYLTHVAGCVSMRSLASLNQCHPSTIHRAVGRVELRRDDFFFDTLCDQLIAEFEYMLGCGHRRETDLAKSEVVAKIDELDKPELKKEAERILRRMSEPGSFLAIARNASKACVFRKTSQGIVTLAKIDTKELRFFVAQEWIVKKCASDMMARYEITDVGRAWLKRELAARAKRRMARSDEQPNIMGDTPFALQHKLEGERAIEGKDGVRVRKVNLGETPLGWLARRKGPDGKEFLSHDELAAGEKLREDFELAHMGPRVAQDWRRFLTPSDRGGTLRGGSGPAEGPSAARDRVLCALDALGPGLGDAALRACCFLEGLEATEKRMGWSARSGKVVLKIALMRLAQHYAQIDDPQPANTAPETKSAAVMVLQAIGVNQSNAMDGLSQRARAG